jgi:hypothetical protein
MSVRYLKHCTPRITDIAKRLGDLWEKKRMLIPQDACFEIEADFQLATMVRSTLVACLEPMVTNFDKGCYLGHCLRRPLRGCSEAPMQLSITP